MVALPALDEPVAEAIELDPVISQEYEYGKYLYFDIETIPDQSEGALKKCREEVKPPANLKKQESIDLWMTENAEKKARELLSKTSLDGATGHVCSIGWAINDGYVHIEHAETLGEEAEILNKFFRAVPKRDAILVGHNILGFDIPFLLKRAVILGVELPSDLTFPRDPKPWSNGVFDTMTAWEGARGMISMNRLCGQLGIVGKEDFDGSMVADAWSEGHHMRIAEYCDSDVRRTRRIHQKFLKAGF